RTDCFGRLRHDMGRADGVELRASVAVSCLDQIGAGASVYLGGVGRKVSVDALPAAVAAATELTVSAVSATTWAARTAWNCAPALP
ncbi:hypothetical protein, partial [Klebsiella pneumoniae]|uniref:hypothetical protein n=1 Tax=Klebsiella pneumoniae TaxID=573 RepID=UPI001C537DF0